MRFALFLVIAALPCAAQFQDLATTHDGSDLYFSSAFTQTGEERQVPHRKLFRWTQEGFELVAQREQTGSGRFANFYEFVLPDVSADGSVVTATASRRCSGGSSCLFVALESPELITDDNPFPLRFGKLQVSDNGRFLLLHGPEIERLDQETDERLLFPGRTRRVAADRQAITSDGRILLIGAALLGLWDGDSIADVRLESQPLQAVVSDDGSRVLFVARESETASSLWAMRADGSERSRLEESGREPFHPALSADGNVAVHVADRRIVVTDLTLQTDRRLDQPASVVEATISGNGEIVFAATSLNELWRIDLLSGAAERIVDRVPAPSHYVRGAPVPGSLRWFRGSGLAPALALADAPYPRSFEGVTVEVGGTQAAIVAVAPEQIVYQIPWEATLGPTELRLTRPEAPFEATQAEATLVERQFEIVRFGREAYSPEVAAGAVVVDQDFQRLITQEDGARPGEIVHVYATGLGETVGAPATGEPTPSEPLPWLLEPLACVYEPQGDATETKPLDLLYAGLAPGLVGLYQVTFRIPSDVEPIDTEPRRFLLIARCDGQSSFAVWLKPD